MSKKTESAAYSTGYESKMIEIRGMGFAAARDKFNIDNKIGERPKSLEAYYYAEGEMAALIETLYGGKDETR